MPPRRRVRISDENRAIPVRIVTTGPSDPALAVTSGPSDPVRVVTSGRSDPLRMTYGHSPYCDKVGGYAPDVFWPLDETEGDVAYCLIDSAQDGTYYGPALGNSPGPDPDVDAPLFDGTDDYVDVLSAALLAVFNGDEGTLSLWYKAFNAAAWLDLGGHTQFMLADTVEANRISVQHPPLGTELLDCCRRANTVNIKCTGEPGAWNPTTWQHLAMTWSMTADELIYYRNGTQPFAAVGALQNWTGAGNHYANIGRYISAGVPESWWHGWIQYVALWDSVLPIGTIADLATID